jgi:sulfate permease, SulP family
VPDPAEPPHDPADRAATGPSGLLPSWLSGYQRAWLRDDALAGGTLAVVLIPQAMAYAVLAGVPAITGLYAAVAALLAYALVGGSSQLSFGPFALVSLLTAAAIEPLAGGDPVRAVALAGVLALMVAALHLAMGLLRAGAVINLISYPVVVGFTSAAGLIIALTQVGDLLGVDLERTDRFVDGVMAAVPAVADAHGPTVVVAGLALAALVVGRYLPRVPMPLLVTIGAIVAAVALDLEAAGVAVVGDVPAGLPRPGLPDIALSDARAMLGPAAVLALVAYAGNVSIAKTVAARTRERVDPNRELLASSAANAASGVAGGFPVAGSLSRTAVVHDAGGRTQLAGVAAAVVLLVTLVLFTGVFEPLPRAVLAAIVIMAVVGLVDVGAVAGTFRVDRLDGAVLLATFVATLILGVELGLLVGVTVNLGGHLARGMRPSIIELGRVQGTTSYRNVERYPTVTDERGAILRLDGPLNFLSVEEVTGRLRSLVATRPELDWLLLDASGLTGMDSTGVHALRSLQQDLAEAGVALHLATVRGRQRDVISRAGLWTELIEGTCHADIADALAAIGLPDDAPLRSAAPYEVPPDELL